MNEEEKEEVYSSGLSRESTLKEVFDHIAVKQGVNVTAVTLEQSEHDTRMMILIQGEHKTASVIMAQLMAHIGDLSDTAKQKEQDEQPRILLPGSGS